MFASSRIKGWSSVAETESARLTLPEGGPLVHAMVSHLARRHGIRALLIKGPILQMQGLREPRQSGDVDVLCEPARVEDLTGVLRGLGWEPFNEYPVTPQVLDRYALSYIHPRWPCSIDVHHRFPGFYADPGVVFDVLWSRRSAVELAAQSVDCTDVMGSAMVHGLHLMRGRDLALTESDITFLVNVLQERLDDVGRRELAEMAAATGSADTLAPLLDRIGAPQTGRGHLSQIEHYDWNLRLASSESRGVMWIEELRAAGPLAWPSIVWRALTFDGRALFEGRLLERRGLLATVRLITHRLRDALRLLPGALKAAVRTGRRS